MIINIFVNIFNTEIRKLLLMISLSMPNIDYYQYL